MIALFALLNVASEEIAFCRAAWHSNPVPHASSQFCPSAPNLNAVLRLCWHGGDADGSWKNVAAQTQSDFDVEAAGLEESLGPHV